MYEWVVNVLDVSHSTVEEQPQHWLQHNLCCCSQDAFKTDLFIFFVEFFFRKFSFLFNTDLISWESLITFNAIQPVDNIVRKFCARNLP